jgi:hypothetical protein
MTFSEAMVREQMIPFLLFCQGEPGKQNENVGIFLKKTFMAAAAPPQTCMSRGGHGKSIARARRAVPLYTHPTAITETALRQF